MKEKELPFGSQFSPNVIKPFSKMIEILKKNEKKDVANLENDIYKNFYQGKSEQLAYNCKVALTAYEIIEDSEKVQLTEFGKNLITIDIEEKLYQEMAVHILKYLNGLALIDTLKKMEKGGERITNESVNDSLIARGYNVQKTSNYVQVMKLWLEKAGVLSKWHVEEERLDELIGIKTEEITLYKELNPEQFYFLMALCNTGSQEPRNAKDIRDLAIASY